MKRILLFLCLSTLPFLANAQCDDCSDKDVDWRFAAGLTLYSNNLYDGKLIPKPYKPLEFNFRYKVGTNHVIRMSIPVARKVDLGRIWTPYDYDGQESLEDYFNGMLSKGGFQRYNQIIESHYSLYGIALGYDYNYSFTPVFSTFGGIELAYYYSIYQSKYNEILYWMNAEDYRSSLDYMRYLRTNLYWNVGAVKPLAGIRYQFQKLLFEASIAYSLGRKTYIAIDNMDYFYPDFNASNHISTKLVQPHYGNNHFEYQFSMYYSF